MYAIKIMSSENLGDSEQNKGFKIILVGAGDSFEFGHDREGCPIVTVCNNSADGDLIVIYPVTGNTYILSESGKTIATYWPLRKTPSVPV